ncbi:hypothetical protein CPB84DRAFT_1855891 [Gymnopilus junonius]|uniref:Uncharacterized protein n=1 Tax=Gymnopilus junonius TaxID=109634 RepID=A0A9P5N9L3_GYMJU|nr:hypothetical protein CPB84DRAFT_1855891 [Gymnopilus junonius]
MTWTKVEKKKIEVKERQGRKEWRWTSKRFRLAPKQAYHRSAWQRDGIVSHPECILDYVKVMPQFQNFIECLHHHESYLFSFRDPKRLSLLGVELNTPSQLSEKRMICITQPDELSVFEYLDICSLISAYKLFEIVALLHGCVPRSIPSATHPRLHLPKVKLGRQSHEKEDLYGYTKLHDWIGLAHSFKAAVESYVDKEPEIPASLPSNPIESLLCMLRANEKKTSYNAIESNFIRAAIHVGCQRMVVFPEHMVPDLPGDLQKLGYSPTTNQEADSSLGVDLTVSQSYRYEFVDYGADKPKNNLAADRVTLTVAEFIMPFYLWMPFKLAKKSFSHRTVLDRSSQLGPDKPPTVLNVEMACWKTVFRLSEGRTKPYHALRDLALSIDWQEVDRASSSVHEHTWFSLEERPLECAPDIRVIPVPDEDEDAMSTSSPVIPIHSLSASQSTDVPSVSTVNAAVIADELPPTTSMSASPSLSTSLLPPGSGEPNPIGVEGLPPLQSSPVIGDAASPSPSSNPLISRTPALSTMSPAVSQLGVSETLVPSLGLSVSLVATLNRAPLPLQLPPVIGNAASPSPSSHSPVSIHPELPAKPPQ